MDYKLRAIELLLLIQWATATLSGRTGKPLSQMRVPDTNSSVELQMEGITITSEVHRFLLFMNFVQQSGEFDIVAPSFFKNYTQNKVQQ